MKHMTAYLYKLLWFSYSCQFTFLLVLCDISNETGKKKCLVVLEIHVFKTYYDAFLKKEEKPAELGIKWKTKQCLA